MGVFSGKDGSMKWTNGAVARVRNWSLQASFDTLDTTNLGEIAREYTAGLKGATGSATIFYHDDNNTLRDLLNSCIRGAVPAANTLELLWGQKKLVFAAFINNVTITCNTGEVMSADVSFTMTGDYTTITL